MNSINQESMTKVLKSMPGKNNFKKFMLNSNSILVFLYTGTDMMACVAHKNKNGIDMGSVVHSRSIDTIQAINEILEKLDKKGEQRPTKAILGSIEVVNGIIDLPVDPQKPRDFQQMQELVRWEVDPFLSELNDVTTIGALLQGRGCINAEQRDQIALEMEIHESQGQRIRFGEIALELKLIKRDDLDECLSLQEHLVNHDAQVVSGWLGSSIKNDEGETNHYWNVCAIDKHRRNHWTYSFESNGIKLVNLYPLYGSSAKSIVNKYSLAARDLLFVEVFQEQLFSYRMKEGKLVSIRIERRIEQKLNESIFVSLCFDQLRPDMECIDIISDEEFSSEIIDKIEAQLQRKVRITSSFNLLENSDEPTIDSPWLLGLAENALLKKDRLYNLPSLLPDDPSPPVWKRPDFWRYGIPAMIFVSLIAFDISQRFYLNHLTEKLEVLEKKYTKAGKVSNQLNQINSLSNNAKDLYEGKEKELDEIKSKYDILNDKLYSRIRTLPDLLRSIASSVNSNIVLDTLKEYERKSGIRITGSTLSNQDAQRFVGRLNKQLEPFNLVTFDVQVEQFSKRLGRDGYSFNLWLIKKNEIIQNIQNKEVALKQ